MRARTRECWQEATFRANGLAISHETQGTLCLEGGWTDLEEWLVSILTPQVPRQEVEGFVLHAPVE